MDVITMEEINEHTDEAADRVIRVLKAALDAGAAEEAGFGDGSDGEFKCGATLTVSNQAMPLVLQTTSFTLPAGQTLTVNRPCAGLYIYSHGDIVIDGTINMTDKGFYVNSTTLAPSNLTINGESVALAQCGTGGASQGGAGGGFVSGNAGKAGGTTSPSAQNHTCGGKGAVNAAGGGCGANQYPNTVGTNGRTPDAMTNGAGAVVLIAYGSITINGTIISRGQNNTSVASKNGRNALYNGYTLEGNGGRGGDGGSGGCGGGAVTCIYKKECTINGSLQLGGGVGGGVGSKGPDGYDSYGSNESNPILKCYGGAGGRGNAGSAGNIIQKKVGVS